MIGGISSGAAEGGDAGADFTGLLRRLRALLTRDVDAGVRSQATPDEGTGGGAHPGPPVDVPPSPSSLEQLAGLEHLHGKNEDLALGPLLRDVVCEVPRLLVEVVACDVDVHAHDEDLRTVLRNLLMNVRDHAGGRAVISCRAEERRVRVTIADNGPGLRPMQLATLFQRGARGPGSNGLGLGLHVARLLCRRQGGDLRLLRSVGGCTFEIVLWAAGGPDDPGTLPSQRRGHGAPAPAPSSADSCEG
jgi:signal transduction histidine kinase